jgi:hypothetical protein
MQDETSAGQRFTYWSILSSSFCRCGEAEPALRVGAGVEYRDVWICTFGKRTSGILASAVPHSTVCRLNC